MSDLNEEQIYILETTERIEKILYTGESADMDSLIENGLMRYIGKQCMCHHEYFALTEKGEEEVKRLKEAKK